MYVFDDKDNFRVNLRRSLQMALIAKVKRFLSPKIIKAKNKYIHIGCGYHKFNNFDNLDFYNSSFSFCDLSIENPTKAPPYIDP